MLTWAQCDQIIAPCYRQGLPAAGYAWSFPRAILQAPYKYFGLGITNLYDKQGIQHILALLHYGTNPDNTTGKLICIGLETLWLELGINGQLFAQDWNSLKYLVSPMWITHTWQFQAEHGIWIETTTLDIHLSQEGDQLLTALFCKARIKGKELATLNSCSMFLQATTLADISNGTGLYIADNMLAGQENTTFSSGYTWPNQQKPSKQDWVK